MHDVKRQGERGPDEWVLMTYRLPRDPSTPRSAVWRKLKGLGVAQLGDGLVALPADARTNEQLEWVAEQVRQADGVASLWRATPTSAAQERDVAAGMARARAAEYEQVLSEATAAMTEPPTERLRSQRRLRAELRRIRRRDYFPPVQRDAAVAAVEALGRGGGPVDTEPGSASTNAAAGSRHS